MFKRKYQERDEEPVVCRLLERDFSTPVRGPVAQSATDPWTFDICGSI